ncbi:hypothetical protein [Terrisporobacter muris]|uniref:Uncharacterized protein n=1 Tax=Terrisporobacter muris TaxID=2963284 RepID=A0A9X2MDD7_9FIRM|nr:hypothetical protein [Terrisporobacter muris]MCR1823780.1 hypothetical protein [Terrisporobacter muris]
MKYDAEYRIGNAKVFIVSPENEARLGRKMTQEEIDAVLKNIAEQKCRFYEAMMVEKKNSI